MQETSDRHKLRRTAADAKPIEAAHDLERLVRAMRAGEVAALSRLYHLTVRQVFAMAHYTLRSREDAEEIVLDVYLHAWRNASAYDAGRGSVRAWLSIITKHRAIDRLRRPRIATVCDDRQQEMFTMSAVATDPGPEQTLVGIQASAAIDRALQTLSEERRTLVRLAFVEGLTHEEIAAVVGKPLGTVKSHIRRALVAMQRQLLTHA